MSCHTYHQANGLDVVSCLAPHLAPFRGQQYAVISCGSLVCVFRTLPPIASPLRAPCMLSFYYTLSLFLCLKDEMIFFSSRLSVLRKARMPIVLLIFVVFPLFPLRKDGMLPFFLRPTMFPHVHIFCCPFRRLKDVMLFFFPARLSVLRKARMPIVLLIFVVFPLFPLRKDGMLSFSPSRPLFPLRKDRMLPFLLCPTMFPLVHIF